MMATSIYYHAHKARQKIEYDIVHLGLGLADDSFFKCFQDDDRDLYRRRSQKQHHQGLKGGFQNRNIHHPENVDTRGKHEDDGDSPAKGFENNGIVTNDFELTAFSLEKCQQEFQHKPKDDEPGQSPASALVKTAE